MITIVDYRRGNLRSVQKAFEHLGYEVQITDQPDKIARAEKLVLPGVGAFADAMRELQARQLVEPILAFLQLSRPFLGICLGLQLLFESSEEGGNCTGLGVVPGRVRKFALPPPWKVPHMGWNQVELASGAAGCKSLRTGDYVYFVHSYYVEPADSSWVALTCTYVTPFCAMIARDAIVATQFHPEKSQAVGLRLLDDFASM